MGLAAAGHSARLAPRQCARSPASSTARRQGQLGIERSQVRLDEVPVRGGLSLEDARIWAADVRELAERADGTEPDKDLKSLVRGDQPSEAPRYLWCSYAALSGFRDPGRRRKHSSVAMHGCRTSGGCLKARKVPSHRKPVSVDPQRAVTRPEPPCSPPPRRASGRPRSRSAGSRPRGSPPPPRSPPAATACCAALPAPTAAAWSCPPRRGRT